jgi:hypothetical protein
MPAAAVESVTQNRRGMERSAARMAPGCVQQVRNQFRILRMGQRRADHAGRTVMEAAHGIEQVREARGAMRQRGHAIVIAAGGVADLHLHAAMGQLADQLQVAVHFRGDGDELDGARLSR